MQAMYELEPSVQFANLLNNCLSISSSIITWLGYRRGKHEVDFYIVFKKERYGGHYRNMFMLFL